MSHDLTDLLNDWPHEPGRVNARRIEGTDGRPKIQVRLELGILQMDAEGRPDGARPHGADSLLEHHWRRREHYLRQTGTHVGFVLAPDECRALREEAVQYYHRYVALLALGDYDRVIRDTSRNLDVLDLCRDCAAEEDDRRVLEQLRPSIVTTRTRAEAELAIALQRPRDAITALDRGLAVLRDIFAAHGHGEAFERSNEAQLLRGMRDALVPKLPASQRAELLERLQAALDAENYELAAILRDELKMMRE